MSSLVPLRSMPRLAGDLLLAYCIDLAHHLFDPSLYLFAIFAKRHRLAPQGFNLLFPFLELLAQPLHVAFGREPALTRSLIHLNSAINLVFQSLEIVGRNLG